MKINIIEDIQNKPLNRREIKAEMEFEKIPSRNEVRSKMAAVAGTDEKSVIIERIGTQFGNNKATILATVYKDEKTLKAQGQKHLLKRNFGEEKKEEAKIEEKKAEAKGE